MAALTLVAVGRQLFGGSFVIDVAESYIDDILPRPVQSTNHEEATNFLSRRLPTLHRNHEGHRLSIDHDSGNTFVYCWRCKRPIYTDIKEQ